MYIYIYQKHILQLTPRGKVKKKTNRRQGGLPEAIGVAAITTSVPQTCTEGQCLLQMFPDEVSHRQDLLS
jgi:hypothetical protein